MKPVYSFRLDKKLVEEAKKSGVNISSFLEASLAKLVKEKKCPYCGERKSKGGGK
jgi:post-segregation antitoxin (ccd killing protein)